MRPRMFNSNFLAEVLEFLFKILLYTYIFMHKYDARFYIYLTDNQLA